MRLSRLRTGDGWPAYTAAAIAVGIYLAWAGHAAWEVIEHWGTPQCSWPVQIRGTASPAQAGLVQCYLQALATRDVAELQVVAADIPPVRITKADLEYSADARSGLATAALEPNPNDPFFYGVTITYADGATEDATMMNMIEMGGPDGWRMNIGTLINSGPPGPPGYPPATAGPAPSS